MTKGVTPLGQCIAEQNWEVEVIYDNDEEGRDAWDAEREAFMQRSGEEWDLEEADEAPTPARFYMEVVEGLPVVRDRLLDDMVCARFLTLKAALSYMRRREHGQGHAPALLDSIG